MRIETYLRKNQPVVWRTGIVKAVIAGIAFTGLLALASRLYNQGMTLENMLIAHVDKIQDFKYLLDFVVFCGVLVWITRVRRFQLEEFSLRLILGSFLLYFPICLILFFGPLQAQIDSVDAVNNLVPEQIDSSNAYAKAEAMLLSGGDSQPVLENDLAQLLREEVVLVKRDVADLILSIRDDRIYDADRFEKIDIYKKKQLSEVIRFELFDKYTDAWTKESPFYTYVIADPKQLISPGASYLGDYEVLKSLAQANDFFNGRGYLFSACASLLLAFLSSILLCAASFGTVSSRVRFLSPFSLLKTKFSGVFGSLEHYFSRRHPLFWLLGAHRSVVEFVFSLLFVVPAILVLIALLDPLWEDDIETIYFTGAFLLIPILYLWDWFSRQSNIYQIYKGWPGTLRIMLASILLVAPIMVLTSLVMVLANYFQIPSHDPLYGSTLTDKDILGIFFLALALCGWASPMLVMATQNIRYLRAVYILSTLGFFALLVLAELGQTPIQAIGISIVAVSLLFLFFPPQRAGMPGKLFLVFAAGIVLLNMLIVAAALDLDIDLVPGLVLSLSSWFVLITTYIYQINRINLVPSADG